MRTPTRYLGAGLVLAATLAVGLGSSQAAAGSKRTSIAQGTFKFATDFFSTTSGTAAEISQLTYKGAITGVAIDKGTAQLVKSFSGNGTEYCADCTIAGKRGAFIATYKYSGSGNTYSGTQTFTKGFGKLAGLKGGGTFKGNIKTNSNTYKYHYTLP
jgi:hypothetical protein